MLYNTHELMEDLFDEIFQLDFPILNIGDRKGLSYYIDFIMPEELLDHNVMKGQDSFGRRFIVFKSEVKINDKKNRLFTIYFQRYSTDEILYHTAGHYGTHMFDTIGGSTLIQIKYLCDFLKNGYINLSVEEMKQFRVGYRDGFELNELAPEIIDTITIGWSDK